MASSLFLLPIPLVAYVLFRMTSPTPPRPSASASPSPSSASLPSLLLRLTTTHKRLLPTSAQHAFEYPLLYYGLDLEDLEEKRLDRRFGNLGGRGVQAFGFARKDEKGNKAWAVTGLGEGSYLSPTLGGGGDEDGKMGAEREEEEGDMSQHTVILAPPTQPLRHKLIHLLSLHLASPPPAIASRLGRVYLVTMPAFLGKEGINPLSVWFCYDKQDDPATGECKLWSVILEVHNTFGERHVYVLEVGKGEHEKVPIGSKHRWTFPRSFHVSPFNSRDGYYTLSLLPPTFPPATSSSPAPPIALSISLLLLTPSKTPKLFARLSSTPHTPPLPFTARNIVVQTLFKFPVALLATTPRIMWNAGVLAFSKGLRVYGRPEQVGRKLAEADTGPPTPADDSGVGSSEEDDASASASAEGVRASGERPLPDDDWGKVQTDPTAHPGGLVWLPLSSTEVRVRELAVQYLHSRLATLSPTRRIKVVITPSEPHLPTTTVTSPRSTSSSSADDDGIDGEEETLDLLPISPVAFTLLLLSPSAAHSLATLARPGPSTLLHISNPSLFLTLFTSPPPPTPIAPSLPLRALHLIRARNPLSPASVRALSASGQSHWADSLGDAVGWKLVAGVGGTVLAEWMEEGVMRGLGVGFVKGGEGWRGVWRASG